MTACCQYVSAGSGGLSPPPSSNATEKKSGATREGRAELQTLLDFVREGDVIAVTRVDRIARSIADLQDILRILKTKGVALKATEQPIDTSTPLGKCLLDLLGVFAELETNLRRERQAEAIRRLKEIDQNKPRDERTYRGRPPSISPGEVRRLKDEGMGATAIAETLGIGRASVYRLLKEDNAVVTVMGASPLNTG